MNEDMSKVQLSRRFVELSSRSAQGHKEVWMLRVNGEREKGRTGRRAGQVESEERKEDGRVDWQLHHVAVGDLHRVLQQLDAREHLVRHLLILHTKSTTCTAQFCTGGIERVGQSI